MKIRSLAIVAAALIVTAVATPALAMYHPGMGRFMQRDPHGTMNVAMAPRIAISGLPAPGGFAPRDPMPAQSQPGLQYADGMNLYQYVRSRPTVYLDPSGLRIASRDQATATKIMGALNEACPVLAYEVKPFQNDAGETVAHEVVITTDFTDEDVKKEVCCKILGRQGDTPPHANGCALAWAVINGGLNTEVVETAGESLVHTDGIVHWNPKGDMVDRAEPEDGQAENTTAEILWHELNHRIRGDWIAGNRRTANEHACTRGVNSIRDELNRPRRIRNRGTDTDNAEPIFGRTRAARTFPCREQCPQPRVPR